MSNYFTNNKKKFFIATTIPATFTFFKGNLSFLRKNFDICAISSDPEHLDLVGKSEGIRTYCIPMVRNISIFNDFYCLIKFILFFLKEKPTIVHGNTPKAALLSMIAGKLTGIPTRIYMCHGLRYQGAKGLFRDLLMLMEKLTCACASEIICVSHGVCNNLLLDKISNDRKVKVIGYGSANGVDLNYFSLESVQIHSSLTSAFEISDNSFVFTYVGRLVRDKGINELISAFYKLSLNYTNVHLILVGSEDNNIDPIDSVTIQTIQSCKFIHAVGFQSDIRPFLKCSNALVLPSYREGFGMVLIEAGAMGVPSIASDIIGCNEIIESGINGDLVKPKDVDGLYTMMKAWVDNPKYVSKLASNIRKTVQERYEQHYVWDLLLAEYNRLSNVD